MKVGENVSILKVVLVVALGCVLFGCAITPQKTVLVPDVSVSENNIGQGRTFGIVVHDERPDRVIGRRGTGAMAGAAIETDQDVAAVFLQVVTDGFEKRGFRLSEDPLAAGVKIEIELRELRYHTSMGFWTGGVHVNAAMKLEAEAGEQSYEEFYRVDEEERVFFVNFADENEAIINTAVTKLIQKLFDDTGLLEMLAG